MDLTIHCNRATGILDHFWESTGFTPANLLLNADMQQAMAYTGGVAHCGIRFVRIHYLLELVTAEALGTPAVCYDWSRLDAALDVLVRNGLKPFFELMGDVSGGHASASYFDDYTNLAQAEAWKQLIRALAEHLEARYGADEVRGWRFETWNEPDVGFWKQSEAAFCTYYDACSEGLREADPELILGGPGTCRGLSSMMSSFLEHCDRGTNALTGETGVRLQFISVHEKGVRAHKEDLNPDMLGIVEREVAIVDYIRQHHPRLAKLPFLNDECDPQVGWGDIHTWRAKPYYAALIAKAINQHLLALVDDRGCSYGLLSNDNGFLGTWGNRTHFARFAELDHLDLGQAEGQRDAPRLEEDPRRRRFALIKKPAFSVMSLLAMLGDERLAIEEENSAASDVGIIATRHGAEQIALLVYHSRDRIMSSGSQELTLHLDGIPFTTGMLVHYRIDEEHGNPFAIWEAQHAPRIPSWEQLARLRATQELALAEEPRTVTIGDGSLAVKLELPLPGVSLILLSARCDRAPAKVTGLRVEHYEGLTGSGDTMVLWRGLDSRFIRTYEILFSASPDGPFTLINAQDQVDSAYLHVESGGRGSYQVRAVDYWGQTGEASDPITL